MSIEHISKSRTLGWVRLLISTIRMSHLANWSFDLTSKTVRPFGDGKGEEDVVSLVYYEIAVTIIEYMLEQDRQNGGKPVLLADCIEDIIFSPEINKMYPDISEEAVQRVIATLATPTPVPFKILGGRVFKEPTAIIRKVAARGVERYYLTDTGFMLCGLSHTAEEIENLDLDMILLRRFLKNGQFSKFINTCDQEVAKIHKLSRLLIQISKEPTFDSQWAMTVDEGEKVTKTLKKSRRLALSSYNTLSSKIVQDELMRLVNLDPANISLEGKMRKALQDVIAALSGLRSNFTELLKNAQNKRHTLVPVIDFFQSAVNQFENGELSDQLIDSHLTTFGLITPRFTRKEDDGIWASTSAFELLWKIQKREAAEAAIEKTTPLPPPEKIVDQIHPFDKMLRDHGLHLIEVIKKQNEIHLDEYLRKCDTSILSDESIPSLYSLFVDPSPLTLFGIKVVSGISQSASCVLWKRRDGKELHLTNLFLKMGA